MNSQESRPFPLEHGSPRSKKYILSLVLPVALGLTGLSLFAWALTSALFRDAEHHLVGRVCLPVSVALALLMLALTITGKLGRFAIWFSLAVIGQAAALQLIEAGREVRYQHYVSASDLLTSPNILFTGILLVQAIAVAAGLKNHFRSILSWLQMNFRAWQLLFLGGIFIVTSAALSREVTRFLYEILVASIIQLIFLANLGLAFLAVPSSVRLSWTDRWNTLLYGTEEVKGKSSWFSRSLPLAAAAWVTLIAALLSYFVYQNHPHVQDEVMYLFQARYLAEGLWSVPAPPVPEAFTLYMIPFHAGRWYSIFPPGWPALLSLGIRVGTPWLINPILGGMGVLLAGLFMKEIYDQRTARLVVLLLAVSPWYIFLSMSFMAHLATLDLALLAALALVRARQDGRIVWPLLSGAAVGAVSLIRLVDGFILGGLLALWAIGLGGRRLRISGLAAFGISTILVTALNLGYNARITGSPVSFPLDAYYEEYYGPKTNAMGFGPERGLGWPLDAFPGHSPLEAVLNAALNSFNLNIELFGWATGSLVLAAIALLSGRLKGGDLLMVAVLVAVVGVLSLYWFSGGPDFGARYWFLMIVPLAALTARGIHILEEKIWGAAPVTKGTGLGLLIFCLFVLTLVNFLPWRSIDKYYHYLGMRPDVRQLDAEYRLGESIVLVQGNLYPDYQSAWVYNPLYPDEARPIFAWDASPQVRRQILAAYPDRQVWVLEGPSITGAGYRIAAGPLPASAFIEGK